MQAKLRKNERTCKQQLETFEKCNKKIVKSQQIRSYAGETFKQQLNRYVHICHK